MVHVHRGALGGGVDIRRVVVPRDGFKFVQAKREFDTVCSLISSFRHDSCQASRSWCSSGVNSNTSGRYVIEARACRKVTPGCKHKNASPAHRGCGTGRRAGRETRGRGSSLTCAASAGGGRRERRGGTWGRDCVIVCALGRLMELPCKQAGPPAGASSCPATTAWLHTCFRQSNAHVTIGVDSVQRVPPQGYRFPLQRTLTGRRATARGASATPPRGGGHRRQRLAARAAGPGVCNVIF